MNKYFIKPNNLIFLKKNFDTFFSKKIKINIFFKKGKYIIHNGLDIYIINIPIVFLNTNASQYLFTKKPFCGPLKKIKV